LAIDVEDLYRRYGPMVLRRCRKLLRDPNQAWDAMQDTFVQVLRYERRLDAAAPSSLLYRIATNVCLNRLRTTKRRPEDKDETLLLELASLDDGLARSGARALLASVFGGESESTSAMAVMHWVDGMTLEEVAREVGMSVSGVRKRLRQVKARVPDTVSEVL
jgi:RNA polymerase sigma factor (sigma-70 family)